MRFIQYLLVCIIAMSVTSCKQKASEATDDVQSTDTPVQWLTFDGNKDMPHIVFVSGDEEYRSEEALPMLAKIMNKHHGFNCTVLFAQDPVAPGIINPNYGENIPGLASLANADLMVNFTRFRALPDDQMQHFENYLVSGKPVIGIRTATHAFHFREAAPDSKWAHYGNFHDEDDEWKGGFGRLVLGEKWISHHGHHRHQSTRGIIASGQESHPILTGIENGSIWAPTDVYGVRLPMPGDTQPLVLGQVVNREGEYNEDDLMFGMRDTDTEIAVANPERLKGANPNSPMMPVAWTKSYQLPGGKTGQVFASTIGASTDLLNEPTVDAYNPTPFAFVDDEYWTDRHTTVSSLAMK